MKQKLLFLMLSTFAFGQAQQLQSVTYQNWETDHWQDWMKQDWVYDTNGDALLFTYKVWDAATISWKNSSQTLITNDVSGQPHQYVNQSWDADADVWLNGSRSTYTYTTFGKVQDDVFDLWEEGHWSPFSKTDYFYDGNHFPSIEFQQTWDAGTATWTAGSSILYTTDTNGNATQYTFGQWFGDALVLSQRVTQTFSATNKILTATTENQTDNSEWRNATKSTFTYDANDFLLHGHFQNWQTATNSWLDSFQHDYANNVDGTVSAFISQQWNNLTWTNFQRAIYDYGILGVAENEPALFAFYPNPAKDFLQVSVAEKSATHLTISDLNGKTFQNLSFSGKTTTVDVRNLSAGVYTLLIQQQGQTQVRKFIKK